MELLRQVRNKELQQGGENSYNGTKLVSLFRLLGAFRSPPITPCHWSFQRQVLCGGATWNFFTNTTEKNTSSVPYYLLLISSYMYMLYTVHVLCTFLNVIVEHYISVLLIKAIDIHEHTCICTCCESVLFIGV